MLADRVTYRRVAVAAVPVDPCRGAQGRLRRRLRSPGEWEVDPCPCPCSRAGTAAGHQERQSRTRSCQCFPSRCRGLQAAWARRCCRDARCRSRISDWCGGREQLLPVRSRSEPSELPGIVVEVFCRCPKAVALERYRGRWKSPRSALRRLPRRRRTLESRGGRARCRLLASARGEHRPARRCSGGCGLRPQRPSLESPVVSQANGVGSRCGGPRTPGQGCTDRRVNGPQPAAPIRRSGRLVHD